MVLFYFANTCEKVSWLHISLLFVGLYGGYQLIYCLYQQEMKTEMKAFLKQNKSSQFGTRFEFNLQVKQVVDEQFSWEEEGSEFRYRGEMYDVVSLEKNRTN